VFIDTHDYPGPVGRLSRLWLLAMLCVLGCDLPPRPPLSPQQSERPKRKAAVNELPTGSGEMTGTLDLGDYLGDWESWDAYYIRGSQVGYSHVKATSYGAATDQGAAADQPAASTDLGLVNYELVDQLKLRRGKSVVVQHLRQTSTETRAGQLISFEAELRIGPVNNQFFGQMVQDKLEIETVRGSTISKRQIDWRPEVHGLIAVQQSVRRRPMSRGEVRKFSMLVPGQFQLAEVTLVCSGPAAIPLLDGQQHKLTEINQQLKIGEETSVETVFWTDEDGNTLKSYTPALQLFAFRTDQNTALEQSVAPEDLLTATGIDVQGTLERPLEAKRVAFSITPSSLVRDPNAASVISPAPDQYTRSLPDGSHQVLISRVVENVQKGFVGAELELVDDDVKPNALVDYRTPLIKRMTDAAVSGRDLEDREVALNLARTVKQLINLNNHSYGLKKASAVAHDGEGDCNGQAVLLAALLRARGIPSRVAAGLVYHSSERRDERPRMVYHMWTLAYVNGRWLSLDATLGREAPPDRITLVTSSLGGGDEYRSLSPIIGVIGQIEIEVLRAQY